MIGSLGGGGVVLVAGCLSVDGGDPDEESGQEPEPQDDFLGNSENAEPETQQPAEDPGENGPIQVDSLPWIVVENVITEDWEAEITINEPAILLVEAIAESPFDDEVDFGWTNDSTRVESIAEDFILAVELAAGTYTFAFLIERDNIDSAEVRVELADPDEVDPTAVNLPDDYLITDVDTIPTTLLDETIDGDWRAHVRLNVNARIKAEVRSVLGEGTHPIFAVVDVSGGSFLFREHLEAGDTLEADLEAGIYRFGFLLDAYDVQEAEVTLRLKEFEGE